LADETGLGKQITRAKTQSTPSSDKLRRYFSLRSWRLPVLRQTGLGAINFVEVVLLNILKVRLQHLDAALLYNARSRLST
jgi:hypothetical protein